MVQSGVKWAGWDGLGMEISGQNFQLPKISSEGIIYIESNIQAVKLKLLKSVSEYHRCTMHCYPLASKIGNYSFQPVLLILGPPLLKAGSLFSVHLPHQVSQEKLLQYIHFNRHHNTILIEHNTKLINQLRTEMETVKAIQGQSKKICLSLSQVLK